MPWGRSMAARRRCVSQSAAAANDGGPLCPTSCGVFITVHASVDNMWKSTILKLVQISYRLTCCNLERAPERVAREAATVKPCNRAPNSPRAGRLSMKVRSIQMAAAALAFIAAPAFASGSLGYHVNIDIQTPTCHGTCTTGSAGTIASASNQADATTAADARSKQYFVGTSTATTRRTPRPQRRRPRPRQPEPTRSRWADWCSAVAAPASTMPKRRAPRRRKVDRPSCRASFISEPQAASRASRAGAAKVNMLAEAVQFSGEGMMMNSQRSGYLNAALLGLSIFGAVPALAEGGSGFVMPYLVPEMGAVQSAAGSATQTAGSGTSYSWAAETVDVHSSSYNFSGTVEAVGVASNGPARPRDHRRGRRLRGRGEQRKRPNKCDKHELRGYVLEGELQHLSRRIVFSMPRSP